MKAEGGRRKDEGNGVRREIRRSGAEKPGDGEIGRSGNGEVGGREGLALPLSRPHDLTRGAASALFLMLARMTLRTTPIMHKVLMPTKPQVKAPALSFTTPSA